MTTTLPRPATPASSPNPTPPQIYSPDQYRQLEERAETRHEYHDGVIVPMTGGTMDHAWIISNLIFIFRLALQNTNFRAYGGELRVWLPEHNRGVYPDVSVIEGEAVLTANRRDEVLNPRLVVEVLSSSTEAYDRGDKFRFYRSLPSLQHYLLVSQTQPLIEAYQREEAADRWILTTTEGLEATLSLPLGDLELPLAQIYQGVEFNPLEESDSDRVRDLGGDRTNEPESASL
ncbi:Uma2 family endonuclease [Prochlorothrix hollandica]|uniref:Uma2 family endonuclease n=1 Tax=Prochlorothrix hollandica TaxID=1223 RepID=UPI00034B173F|nr:Uma2 family endonuclease [Prochlorothrix hollandica]